MKRGIILIADNNSASRLMAKRISEERQKLFLDVIYCDDFRMEVGGKTTLVGVYKQELLVEAFPVTLPKFVVVARLGVGGPEALQDGTLRLFVGKRELGEFKVGDLKSVGEFDKKMLLIEAIIVFEQFKIESECNIRIDYFYDSKIIKGFDLHARQSTSSERAFDPAD